LGSLKQHYSVATAPLSDGGEGFAQVLSDALGGEMVGFAVTGPNREPVEARAGFVDPVTLPLPARQILFGAGETLPSGPVAIVEMASASGLPLLAQLERNPWKTTSRGTGELLRAVAERGAAFVVLGIGGSATSDLGLGALEALGLYVVDHDGRRIEFSLPEDWDRVVRIEGSIAKGMPPIVVACDVRNPLLGPSGAAAIYGPQKGLAAEDISRFDQRADFMARLLCEKFGADFESAVSAPGAGAAGGMFFGLGPSLGARAVSGFDLVSSWFDLEKEIEAADIVVTGEGRFDQTSFSGKAVGQIVSKSREYGRRCVVFAGSTDEGSEMGEERVAISPKGLVLERALAETEKNLAAAVVRHFDNL
jgi:glycerate kinase